MEATLSLVPMVRSNHSSFAQDAEYVPFEEVSEQPFIRPSVNFLEANTSEISIEELTTQCVVPTWANQELTISHQDFIHTVHEAAQTMFSGETICEPAIRVSHIVRGRVPSARKQVSCWNLKRHSSTKDWLLLSPFPPSMKK